jgi:hypothetical protein
MFKEWKRKGYSVVEEPFDHDLHCFSIVQQRTVPVSLCTITPATIEDMNEMKKALDAGESVQGWEDGMGNVINLRRYGIEVKDE